jgi:hypothetical protein
VLKIPAITVGKWRRSFAVEGIEGLRDAPRSRHLPSTIPMCGRKFKRAFVNRPRLKVAGPCVRSLPNVDCLHAILVAAKLQPPHPDVHLLSGPRF